MEKSIRASINYKHTNPILDEVIKKRWTYK